MKDIKKERIESHYTKLHMSYTKCKLDLIELVPQHSSTHTIISLWKYTIYAFCNRNCTLFIFLSLSILSLKTIFDFFLLCHNNPFVNDFVFFSKMFYIYRLAGNFFVRIPNLSKKKKLFVRIYFSSFQVYALKSEPFSLLSFSKLRFTC